MPMAVTTVAVKAMLALARLTLMTVRPAMASTASSCPM